MALTPQQENALLALLDEPLVTLNELPKANAIDDRDLFLTRQDITERAVTGEVMKNYFAAPATLEKQGVVQLTNDANSNSEAKAVTPKGVKTSLANYLPLSGGALSSRLTLPQLCLQSDNQLHIQFFDRNNRLVSGIYQETDGDLCFFIKDGEKSAGTLRLKRDGQFDILGNTNILPIGVPVPWPNTVPPVGWLKCNGSPFDKQIYPALAKAYPSGVLPDLRGEFIRGWDDGRGVDAGRAILSYQEDEFRAHIHTMTLYGYCYNRQTRNHGWGSDDFSVGPFTNETNSNGGNETRPRNVAFLYIVRAA